MFMVILATDGHEERVIAQAQAIANYPCASEEIEVVIVNVAKEIQSDEGGQINIKEYSEMPESAERALSFFGSEGITAEVQQRSGNPAEELVRATRELDADQIVLGGRRRSPVGKAVFGSVVQDVIIEADCPVTTINGPK